ncbi:hypothetical protein QBC40DRAFT_180614 [Triangularia verruculosa]|uniref:Transmembrane and coiled-coil domain-containing protein 4 n=1 Tax=Triangularia verruculosa TaxID=2587418 RepID=A0AAN6XFC1_9PEZI|nr:hypothetical protein QBC40DRAFT_180614 [Triangularia verruculosa]
MAKNLYDLLEVQDNSSENEEDVSTASHHPHPTSDGASVTSTTATEEMPPNGARPRPNTPRREADFSSLLNHAEKVEVSSLLNRLTDLMQRQITQLFDVLPPESNPLPTRATVWDKLPPHLRDLSLAKPAEEAPKNIQQKKENAKPSRSKKGGRSNGRRTDNSSSDTPPAQAQREPEMPLGPRQQELKKEALMHFKRWQTAVLKRAGDISIRKAADGYGSGPKRGSSSYKKKRANSKSQTQTDDWVQVGRPDHVADSQPASMISTTPITLEADPAFWQLYPPIATPLSTLPAGKRCLLLHCIMLLLLSLETYNAYSRILMLNIASSLRLPLRVLTEEEVRTSKAFANLAKTVSFEDAVLKKSEENKSSRRRAGPVGAHFVTTGNLSAPLIAASIGFITGGMGVGNTAAAGLLGTMAENGLVVGNVLGMCPSRAGGKTMEQHAKDVSDAGFIPLRGIVNEECFKISEIVPDYRRIRVVLGVGGWLPNKTDIFRPWRCLGEQNEVYVVRWELDNLVKLNTALETMVKSAAWSIAKKEIIARSSEPSSKLLQADPAKSTDRHGPVYTSLIDARWPAALLKLSKIVDNPWNTCMVRADKLGSILADIISSKAPGERGVSLVGYSLGARAIYTCLAILAERRAFGLVENVVVMGCPAPSETAIWVAMRSVVTGRMVNVYSENDYILGFLCRQCSVEYGVAGLERIVGVDSIEQLDVSAKVSSHLRYPYLVGTILHHIGWEDVDKEQATREESTMSAWEEKLRQHEARRAAVENGNSDPFKTLNPFTDTTNKDPEQGIIRTRMRKKKGKR